MPELTVDRIVRPAEAEIISGYCDVHLRRLEERGEFPRRFKLSDNSGPFGAAGWLLSDIMAWLNARAASRTKDAKPQDQNGAPPEGPLAEVRPEAKASARQKAAGP